MATFQRVPQAEDDRNDKLKRSFQTFSSNPLNRIFFCFGIVIVLLVCLLLSLHHEQLIKYIDLPNHLKVQAESDPYALVTVHQDAPTLLTRYAFPQLWQCPSQAAKEQHSKIQPEYSSQSSEDITLYEKYVKSSQDYDVSKNEVGFFIEMGGLDGDLFSNTRFFERQLNWRGLLIEAQPANAKKLLNNAARPHSVKLPIAVCSPPQTSIDMMGRGGAVAGSNQDMTEEFKKNWHENHGDTELHRVDCLPLKDILVTYGLTHIDFFSLDVEGSEWTVIQSMDLNLVQIHYWLIERNANSDKITQLLAEHGYEKVAFDHCRDPGKPCMSNDFFVNKNYKKPKFADICTPAFND